MRDLLGRFIGPSAIYWKSVELFCLSLGQIAEQRHICNSYAIIFRCDSIIGNHWQRVQIGPVPHGFINVECGEKEEKKTTNRISTQLRHAGSPVGERLPEAALSLCSPEARRPDPSNFSPAPLCAAPLGALANWERGFRDNFPFCSILFRSADPDVWGHSCANCR